VLELVVRGLVELFPDRTTFAQYAQTVRDVSAPRRGSILVACFPKSGSTFLTTALAEATGYPLYPFVYACDRNEQDLYLPALLKASGTPTVTQQHVRASAPNLELARAFHLSTIVLVRDLGDALVSVLDHLRREDTAAPMAYIDQRFFELDEPARVDMLVDLVAPWYVNFYVSWHEAERARAAPMAFLRYEDMIADPPAAIARVLDFAGSPRSRADVERAVTAAMGKNVRFNKGVSGRGREVLSDAHRARLARLASYYPGVDFTRIGLPRA
jgi:hypothetical protein